MSQRDERAAVEDRRPGEAGGGDALGVGADRAGGPGVGASSRISICMINYNGEACLDHTLEAVLGQDLPDTEVVLVDNASTDGSRLLVVERFPGVRLIEMPANLGAAAARNVALERAAADVVVLIDNDVAPTAGAIGKLVNALESAPWAVMAMPAILYGADGSTVQYDGADAHFLGHQTLHHERVPYDELPLEPRDIGSLVSACLVVDRKRLRAEGGTGAHAFDEDFFIYFEDHDFGYRMRTRGLRVLSVPAAACHHGQGTQGLSIRALGGYSPLRVYYHIRNRWIFIIKNYSGRTLLLLAPILGCYEIVQLAGVVKKGWWKEWGRAVIWIATHPRLLLSKRRSVQRARRTPDRVLLRDGPVPLREEATSTSLERSVKRALDGVAGAYWRLVRGLL